MYTLVKVEGGSGLFDSLTMTGRTRWPTLRFFRADRCCILNHHWHHMTAAETYER